MNIKQWPTVQPILNIEIESTTKSSHRYIPEITSIFSEYIQGKGPNSSKVKKEEGTKRGV